MSEIWAILFGLIEQRQHEKQISKDFWFVQEFGGIAQLGERLHGMQEVIGSIPFTSTKKNTVGAV